MSFLLAPGLFDGFPFEVPEDCPMWDGSTLDPDGFGCSNDPTKFQLVVGKSYYSNYWGFPATMTLRQIAMIYYGIKKFKMAGTVHVTPYESATPYDATVADDQFVPDFGNVAEDSLLLRRDLSGHSVLFNVVPPSGGIYGSMDLLGFPAIYIGAPWMEHTPPVKLPNLTILKGEDESYYPNLQYNGPGGSTFKIPGGFATGATLKIYLKADQSDEGVTIPLYYYSSSYTATGELTLTPVKFFTHGGKYDEDTGEEV